MIATLLGLTVLSGLTACSPAADPADPVQLMVRDGVLRELGAECSGSSGYLYIHAGAKLVLRDDKGDDALDVILPVGTAVQADETDYGNAKRVPTVCVFTVDGSGLTEGANYEVFIDQKQEEDYLHDSSTQIDSVPTIAVPPLGVAPDYSEEN
ncbi:hypothetical protein CLV54_0996 [Compostimonas suwonensis]|uniref:Lipoprotein n=2 Tax=Compostimonas suwonensis TaxID=1048394 RepID=A0A2M9BZ19_9MICO|nr:hypothetical protein CLV54_0996 [Compostimonas suwonensis]